MNKTTTKPDCKCINEIPELIKKQQLEKPNNPDGFKIVESSWENFSLFPKTRLLTKYEVTSTFTKKDGSTSRPKKNQVTIMFSYCPFCGHEFDAEDKNLKGSTTDTALAGE
jgi:hypothetical protein